MSKFISGLIGGFVLGTVTITAAIVGCDVAVMGLNKILDKFEK